MNTESRMRRALEIVEKVKPFFAGHDPVIQGAALAELTSLWLAGHELKQRANLLEIQNTTIRELTTLNAEILRGKP